MATSTSKKPAASWMFPIAVVLIVIAGVVLVVRAGFAGGKYATEVTTIADNPAKYLGKDVRVTGIIKRGSTQHLTFDGAPLTRFVIVDDKGGELQIDYARTAPDAYEEGRSCIVEGRLDKPGVLSTSRLTVKCPSKYQSEDDAAPPQAATGYP